MALRKKPEDPKSRRGYYFLALCQAFVVASEARASPMMSHQRPPMHHPQSPARPAISLPVLTRATGSGSLRPDAPKEKCGVFAVWGPKDAAHRAYIALYAQQHRGQESAGIAVSSGQALRAYTGMGLVPEVFDRRSLRELEEGECVGAIGHNRYSTTGGSLACNAQPLLEQYVDGQVAVAHNGNLVNAEALRRLYEENGHIFHTTSDTEVIIHLLASPRQQRSGDPLAATLRRLQGAFSLVFLFPDRIEAARDPYGWRPLVLGTTHDGFPVIASETVALDALGATTLREIEPGEIVTISDEGVNSRRFADVAPRPAHCVFEHVYFASPASEVFGQTVQIVRERLGEQLAREAPVLARHGNNGTSGSNGTVSTGADLVMPMPDSGRSAASGYARISGLPYREGIVPNRYVGRTFIKPSQEERNAAVRLKLNVIREIVVGKRVVVVDDSIVRGTTTKAKMEQIRAAGAKEIHLRISCPPIRHPCYFGVDFAERSQLIAHGRSVEEVRQFLGVDSLAYLSIDGMLACVAKPERPGSHYCTACYSGEYRIDVERPTAREAFEPRQMQWF